MRAWIIVTLGGALLCGCGGSGDGAFSKAAKAAQKDEIPTVPYVVSGSKTSNTCGLWSDAERSAKAPKHKIPSGTKVKLLDKKELPRNKGGTMRLVRAPTGKQGWIPEKFIEYRFK